MAETTALDVAYVARLARIKLTDEEARTVQSQLGQVLEYAAKLRDVDVRDIEPAAHAVPMFNAFREDEPHDGLTVDEALQNAPRKANDLFLVTKVVE